MGISFSNIGTVGREQLITSGSNGEPNWSYIPSKGKSTKTQTEFVSEIKKLAQKAANATDKTEQDSISRQVLQLRAEYLSEVAPDRKQLYQQAKSAMKNPNTNPKCKGIGELTLLDFLEQAEGKNQNLADKQIALAGGGTLNFTILTSGGYGVQIQSQGVNVLLNTGAGWGYEMTPAELTKKDEFYSTYWKEYKAVKNGMNLTSRNIEKKENGSHALVQEDDIQISDSARKLVETARNKVSDIPTMHFSSIDGEIREIPAEYKCENLFKLDLKATSILGEQSAFEGCSENQSEVFEKWLGENASEYLTEDEMKDLKEKINAMTADVDSLNAQEGYRGTSYESVFLLSASEVGLRKVNEMYVPEQFQAGFSDMIDEYVHFNDSARNSIMEKMTPDYMVVGIGSKTESYKYKSEIISDETAFYTNEKKEISGICNQFLNGKTDQKLFCNEMKDRLNDYYGSRYELRNQPEAVEGRVNNMLGILQHMFGI